MRTPSARGLGAAIRCACPTVPILPQSPSRSCIGPSRSWRPRSHSSPIAPSIPRWPRCTSARGSSSSAPTSPSSKPTTTRSGRPRARYTWPSVRRARQPASSLAFVGRRWRHGVGSRSSRRSPGWSWPSPAAPHPGAAATTKAPISRAIRGRVSTKRSISSGSTAHPWQGCPSTDSASAGTRASTSMRTRPCTSSSARMTAAGSSSTTSWW